MVKTIDNDDLPVLISFSGGETSAFMTIHLWNKYKHNKKLIVAFANTGQENEETLIFVNKFQNEFNIPVVWVEAVINEEHGKGVTHKIVTYETASRNGEPFEAVIKKLGIPNQANPHCTRDLKKTPLMKYMKSLGIKKFHTAIGIRADEIDRMGDLYYPLVKQGVTKKHINYFWDNQPFRLNLKGYQGNCKWCWKKSFRKHLTIINENPEAYDFPKRMEKEYGNYINPNRKKIHKARGEVVELPIRFFRGNVSAEKLFEQAKGFTDFAIDDAKNNNYQTDIFNDFPLDISNGCSESCEPF
jgi:hypothetical protein